VATATPHRSLAICTALIVATDPAAMVPMATDPAAMVPMATDPASTAPLATDPAGNLSSLAKLYIQSARYT
jgi:hypothetical protein